MILFILLSAARGLFQDLVYTDPFSPLQILWPNTWVHSRVLPNSNYAASVTQITIFFSVEGYVSDISNYFAGIKFPDDTYYRTCSISALNSAAFDWQAICPYSFAITTALSYGPINLIISASQKGQILAQDFAVGYVGLLPGSEYTGSFSVNFLAQPSSTVHTVQSYDILEFSFDLPSGITMRPGDYILLKADPNFGITKLSISLTWDSGVNTWVLFNNTQAILNTDSSGNNLVYICGLTQQVNSGSSIAFIISGWTNPQTYTAGGSYNWNLSVRRFGSDLVLASFTGNGPNTDVTVGSVTVTSWLPSTSAAFGSTTPTVFTGLKCFWTVSFITQHSIPIGGSVSITFTGLTINTVSPTTNANQVPGSCGAGCSPVVYVSLSDTSKFGTASISSSTSASISFSGNITASTIISLSVIGLIGGSDPTVTTIITKDKSGLKIDQLGSAKSVARVTSGYTFFSFASDSYSTVFLANSNQDSTEVNTINQWGYYGLSINLNPTVGLASGTTVNVYMPVSVGAVPTESNVLFGSSIYGLQNDDSASHTGFTGTQFNTSPGTLTGISVVPGLITFQLAAATTTYFNLFIGTGSLVSPSVIFTPLIPTKKPSEVIIKITQGLNTYYFFSTLFFKTAPVTLSAYFLCPNAILSGSPLRIYFTPPQWTVPSGYSVSVTMSFIVNSNTLSIFSPSNLNDGDYYPCSDLTKGLKISKYDILYYNASLLSNSIVLMSFPMPPLIYSRAYTVNLNIYANSKLTGVQYLAFSASTTANTASSTDTTTGQPTGISSQYSASLGTTITVSLNIYNIQTDLDNDSVFTSIAAPLSYLLITPSGWTTSDTKVNSVSMTSTNAAFPSASYYRESSDTGDETKTSKTISLSLTAGWFATNPAQFFFAVGYGSSFPATKCVALSFNSGSLASLKINTGSLSVLNYSPSTVNAYTYKTRTAPIISLNFQAQNPIGPGSVLTITLNGWLGTTQNSWQVKVGSYTLSGKLNNLVWTSNPIVSNVAALTMFSISIKGASLPLPSLSSITGFSSISLSFNNIQYQTWTDPGTQTKTSVLQSTNTTQGSSQAYSWVFPNFPGSVGVYFYLTFGAIYLIPAGATVAVSGNFGARDSVNYDLFSSHSYSSAYIKKNVLYIITNQDIYPQTNFSFILNRAFDLSRSVTQETISPVLVNVTCNDSLSTVVIQDSALNAAGQVYLVNKSLSIVVLAFVCSSSVLNPGYESLYNFNFTASGLLQAPFWVNIDAYGDFNSIPGPSYTNSDLGSNFKLLFARSFGNDVLCYANHWVISCLITRDYKALSLISLQIYLKNAQTFGYFNLYITDASDNLIAQPFYGTSSAFSYKNSISAILYPFSAFPDYSGDPSNSTADLYLTSYISVTAKAGDSFVLSLPKPFNLMVSNPGTVTCSLIYFNNDSSPGTVESILSSSTCNTTLNTVKFTMVKDKSFTASNWTVFVVNGLDMPSAGYAKNKLIYDISSAFNYYTGQFNLFYLNSQAFVKYASFDNLHSAYAGFNAVKGYQRILVNGENTIFVTPGTIGGPYFITTPDGYLYSNKVTVTGKETFTSVLSLSDGGSYVLTSDNTAAEFYIGSASGTSFGNYLVQWSINEVPIPGTGGIYSKPRTTLVQVSSFEIFSVLLSTSSIIVPPNGPSLPIEVYIDQSVRSVCPYSGIFVVFSVLNTSQNIQISPWFLDLNSSNTVDHFYIKCNNCKLGETYSVNMSIGGTDYSSFTIASGFTFIYQFLYQNGAVFNATTSNLVSNGFEFKIKSDSNAVATWALLSASLYRSSLITYDSLYSQSWVFGSDNTGKLTIDQQVENYENLYSNIFTTYNNYKDITKKLMFIGKNIFIVGQSLVAIGNNSIYNFTILVPSSDYWLVCFLDNRSGNITKSSQLLTTTHLPNHALLTINLLPDSSSKIVGQISSFMKWSKNLVVFKSTSSRELSSQTYLVYANPVSSIDPYLLVTSQATVLGSYLGSTVLTSPISYVNYNPGSFSAYGWDSSSNSILVLNVTAGNDGDLYCTVENGTNVTLTSDQVFQGVGSRGQTIMQIDVEVKGFQSTSASFNFTKMGFNTSAYSVNCIVCNGFPGLPACSLSIYEEYDYYGQASGEIVMVIFSIYYLVI